LTFFIKNKINDKAKNIVRSFNSEKDDSVWKNFRVLENLSPCDFHDLILGCYNTKSYEDFFKKNVLFKSIKKTHPNIFYANIYNSINTHFNALYIKNIAKSKTLSQAYLNNAIINDEVSRQKMLEIILDNDPTINDWKKYFMGKVIYLALELEPDFAYRVSKMETFNIHRIVKKKDKRVDKTSHIINLHLNKELVSDFETPKNLIDIFKFSDVSISQIMEILTYKSRVYSCPVLIKVILKIDADHNLNKLNVLEKTLIRTIFLKGRTYGISIDIICKNPELYLFKKGNKKLAWLEDYIKVFQHRSTPKLFSFF